MNQLTESTLQSPPAGSPRPRADWIPKQTGELPSRRQRLTLAAFACTLFVSAFLLFLVQPMIGKMILPLLGGTPAVWNTCMLFFQAVLLAGYGYAHLLTTRFGIKYQKRLHALALLVPLVSLPIAVSTAPPANANPVVWLLAQLTICAGVPFFVVSASSPLLQRWFAQVGHPDSRDPYFLYAASNVGSLLALLAYPLLLQPILTITDQSLLWMGGYLLLAVLILICAMRVPAMASPLPRSETTAEVAVAKPLKRLHWVFSAFVPSSLMLGVTAHITTNLAPVPLLWVMPLALYLLTMSIAFARRTVIPGEWVNRLLPYCVIPLTLLIFLELRGMVWISIPVHLVAFFVAAMVCHNSLAESRPAAANLTEFYWWMSVGGMLGGVFNALIAPVLFTSVVEYPLAIVLSCLLMRPTKHPTRGESRTGIDVAAPALLALVMGGAVFGVARIGLADTPLLRVLMFAVPTMVCFAFKDRPLRFALGLGVLMAAVAAHAGYHRGNLLFAGRNFFGVKSVLLEPDGKTRRLIHGSTNHGLQRVDSPNELVPYAYYHPTGPIGDVFESYRGSELLARVAIIGLGTGSIATYAEPGQHFTFFEIDPEIADVAQNRDFFRFLSACRGTYDIRLGDGRQVMAESPDRYGIIIVDAFSSDAIPTHLLTVEAIQLYLDRLEEGGLLVFHVSNRYLRLRPLLEGLAERTGLRGVFRDDLVIDDRLAAEGKSPSQYIILARKHNDFARIAQSPNWSALGVSEDRVVWTDQRSSLLPLFRWD